MQDYQTRETLLPLLHDTEEDHIHFLEQQQFQIKAFGLQNYLQTIKEKGLVSRGQGAPSNPRRGVAPFGEA